MCLFKSRWIEADVDAGMERQVFNGIVRLKLDLVGEDWPETVRLNAMNSLGMFIELISFVSSQANVTTTCLVLNSIVVQSRCRRFNSLNPASFVLFEQ